VAVAPSGIPEEGAACWFCVTRCLDGATLDSAGETDDVARAGVVSGTRCLRSHFMRLGGTVHSPVDDVQFAVPWGAAGLATFRRNPTKKDTI